MTETFDTETKFLDIQIDEVDIVDISMDNEIDVIREILEHDINQFYKILSFGKAVSHEEGYAEGKRDLKLALRALIL